MDFWKNVQAAAEKAATAAKDLGKKGLEVVEASAEEASKKLNLNLHDKVGAGPPKQVPPSPAELDAFGITPDFAEFVRTINYSTFRDFPAEHLLPASEGSATGGPDVASSSGAFELNAWQVRHATLVVLALKEVNELRFVLCPKYMTDEHFWHVYFTLARKYLPEKAFSWTATDVLPSFEPTDQPQDDPFSLSGLGNQLMRLGSQLQSATSAARPAGLELTSFSTGTSSSGAMQPVLGAGAAGKAASASAAAAKPAPASGMLEEDPDLEAYLQVAINTSQPGSQEGEEGSGYDVAVDGEEEDLDLDSYINELTEEVEAAAAAENNAADDGGGDAKKD
ncbi:hypothetical protein CHLNCDRAFT_133492 [Chlorella variabilis]|uniref:BSD domain-containing protein n=1 Tax=Chlorella variabilis TaxID=554065 RepID=E1Z380_CHLVA|nr:hypothetical protein CHLNCDRAFT_133492 [Chlorella variabilis]EFN60126.1 hypothetical protein CHLNCDRAFT_133492 [Chlorella variabilis]|eukprot:XP_005852228.1 hypothetical protein CHLNCDRAFT_133492 [Chlorella variabilis]